ncbi:hypothetical protein SHL15_1134 [Streptomyces hygroscopicus subsp. limoneus]|nr:hypothetical protein SHL15_1134 [Streptomyces hygroscopicus subsp. limoneus]
MALAAVQVDPSWAAAPPAPDRVGGSGMGCPWGGGTARGACCQVGSFGRSDALFPECPEFPELFPTEAPPRFASLYTHCRNILQLTWYS